MLDFAPSYRVIDVPASAARAAAGLVLVSFLAGCAQLVPPAAQHPPVTQAQNDAPAQGASLEALTGHIDYMRRAAEADSARRETMKMQAEQSAGQSSAEADIRIGFLLTSPGEPAPNLRRGREMLARVLQEQGDLHPAVRDLIALRVAEADSRRDMQAELDDIRGKIEELMSIESSLEQEKTGSGERRRQ